MLEFNAHDFVGLLNALHALSDQRDGLSQERHEEIARRNVDLSIIGSAIEQLERMRLFVSRNVARDLLRSAQLLGCENDYCREKVDFLRRTLRHELEDVSFFKIDRVQFYRSGEELFGERVADAFPSATYDVEESGKCLAFQRPTACVMHLMRVLEVGLYALVAELGGIPSSNWYNDLNGIVKEIGKRTKASHPGWSSDEPFFSEAASHFRLLKNAWRNHSMHANARYDNERAEAIFISVRSFMQHLATRVSEVRNPLSQQDDLTS